MPFRSNGADAALAEIRGTLQDLRRRRTDAKRRDDTPPAPPAETFAVHGCAAAMPLIGARAAMIGKASGLL